MRSCTAVVPAVLTLAGIDPLAVLHALRNLLAHVGGLSRAAANAGVPSWLTVVTGGVLVGGSFLFNSLLTDHKGIRAVNGWTVSLPTSETVRSACTVLLRVVGVAILAGVLAASFFGPSDPTTNFAILVVWAGWWAGYAMSTYLVGNTWPAVNPWRTIARWLPTGESRPYPERLGAWPSVAGLLCLVWVEVVSPLAAEPTALGALVLGYTIITLVGAIHFGTDTWFDTVDPISRVFRLYGRVAPLQSQDNGVAFRLPGTALTDGDAPSEPGSTAFVVALLWVTTFDGLVATPIWNDAARSTIGSIGAAGLAQDALVLTFYLLALAAGFAVFLGAYRLAAARSRQSAGSYLAPDTIERWLVPSLLPIAAGYHLAHFLGYFLSLSPALGAVLAHPLGGASVARVAVLPAWFGTLQLAFVVVGHLLAVWIAHSLAVDLFPGVLRPIRSQYPFVVVMMVYTMTSAVVIGQPFTEPAFL